MIREAVHMPVEVEDLPEEGRRIRRIVNMARKGGFPGGNARKHE